MNAVEQNKTLVEKYPFLLIRTNYWTGEKLSPEEINYITTWYDEIPEGWAKAFGEQMCDELLKILKKADYVDEYEIVQIKEKFAQIRWYDNGVPDSIWDEYRDWMHKYEELSYNTCIFCGEPATYHTTGWILPVCQKCYDERIKYD